MMNLDPAFYVQATTVAHSPFMGMVAVLLIINNQRFIVLRN